MKMAGVIAVALVSQAMAWGERIRLPPPNVKGDLSLEKALAQRRSVRAFSPEELSIQQLGQLLWAAQGITERTRGFRTAPSAGALYPLKIRVVMPKGVYQYDPHLHELVREQEGDHRLELQRAALGQEAVGTASAVFVFSAVYERTAVKYGERAIRYVHIETGHACQNLLLQATALSLAGVPVGAFHDDRVAEMLNLAENETPLYLVPVGYPKKAAGD